MSNPLPKFEGIPMVPEYLYRSFPQANFLGGAFGEAVHQRIVAQYGDNNSFVTQNIFYDKKLNVVRGSKPGYVVAVDEQINHLGLRTATPRDLQDIIEMNTLALSRTYEDAALVLRSVKDPNTYFAQSLATQIQQRQEIIYPVMIPLNQLTLNEDKSSPYGLVFALKDQVTIIHNQILNQSGNFPQIDENGLPTEIGEGNRCLYTRDSGLSRFILDRILVLYADVERLAGSGDSGRVVVVKSAAGAREN